MIFKIYDPPDGEKTWNELCVGAIVDFTSWEYEKFFCGAGTFELVVPIDAKGVESLKLNRFLATYGGQFIIKQLNYTAENVKVSGYDLNGLLLDRLTVAQTDNGKDKQSGYTETIVKHYVDANCVGSTSTGRNYPGLVIAEDKQRGISNDAASPRLQCVADVISDILSAQQMGWRISATNFNTSGAAKMSFDVFNSKDRTDFESQEYKHVAFSYGLGNTANIKAEKSIAGAKNTLYCELADGTVQTYSPIEDNVGYARTEEYADLNCELGEYTTYADHEIADRFRETDSVTLEHIDPTQFGTDFDIGDIVTVYDDKSKITKAALITAAKIKRSENEYDVTLTIGEARVKLLDRVSKSTKAVTTSVRENTGESEPAAETDRIIKIFSDYYGKSHESCLITAPYIDGDEYYVPENKMMVFSDDQNYYQGIVSPTSYIKNFDSFGDNAVEIATIPPSEIGKSLRDYFAEPEGIYKKTRVRKAAFTIKTENGTSTSGYGHFNFIFQESPNSIYSRYDNLEIKLSKTSCDFIYTNYPEGSSAGANFKSTLSIREDGLYFNGKKLG